jgi:hypothetical protein
MCVIMKPRRNEEAQAHIGLSSHKKKWFHQISPLMRVALCNFASSPLSSRYHPSQVILGFHFYFIFVALPATFSLGMINFAPYVHLQTVLLWIFSGFTSKIYTLQFIILSIPVFCPKCINCHIYAESHWCPVVDCPWIWMLLCKNTLFHQLA